jgi:hypothetical protein
MDVQEYWKNKHVKYALEDWINKPSIFSKFAIKYFPVGANILELGGGQGFDKICRKEKITIERKQLCDEHTVCLPNTWLLPAVHSPTHSHSLTHPPTEA